MRLAIVGTGYVGLVTGACLAEAGNQVSCIDSDTTKVASLMSGRVPFYEPGLPELVRAGMQAGTLTFTTSLADGTHKADVVFLAVGTPSTFNGHADLRSLYECARALPGVLRRDTVVVVKSTVPVGTCAQIQTLLDSADPQQAPAAATVASNPEFLAEGRAIEDFRHPERIVVGCDDERARALLHRLYRPFDPTGDRLLSMDVHSAEFAKYACNAMLAARVSLINELSCIAGQLDADIQQVCRVLRSDPRIGPKYLEPGPGYGGSCLPKDLRALIHMAADHDEPAYMLRSIERVNDRQSQLLIEAISDCFFGELQGRCIAVWGLAFKAGTDDIRAAPSLILIRALLDAGVQVRAYDPIAGPAVRTLIRDPELALTSTALGACDGADALVVMTEWNEFKKPDFKALAHKLKAATLFDSRNLYDRQTLRRHHLRHYQPGQRRLGVRVTADTVAASSRGSTGFVTYN